MCHPETPPNPRMLKRHELPRMESWRRSRDSSTERPGTRHVAWGYKQVMRRILGVILATAFLWLPACDPADAPDAPSATCEALSAALDQAKTEWQANRDSEDLRATMKRAQTELFESGCQSS